MAELLIGWTEARTDEWQATHPGNGQPHQSLLLTVWLDPYSLWQAVAEYKYQNGSWPAQSPFATRQLAMEWAEAQADSLGQVP